MNFKNDVEKTKKQIQQYLKKHKNQKLITCKFNKDYGVFFGNEEIIVLKSSCSTAYREMVLGQALIELFSDKTKYEVNLEKNTTYYVKILFD